LNLNQISEISPFGPQKAQNDPKLSQNQMLELKKLLEIKEVQLHE